MCKDCKVMQTECLTTLHILLAIYVEIKRWKRKRSNRATLDVDGDMRDDMWQHERDADTVGCDGLLYLGFS